MAEPLPFLFDYLSPYAFVAWRMVRPLARRYDRAVEPVPVLLAGLLAAHGTKGPAEIPAKREYTFKDVYRKGRRYGVSIAPPPAHPFNPLLALRVTLAVEGDARVRLVDALYDAVWLGGPGVEDPAIVARIADDVGLEGRALVARAGADEAKSRLRENTERAIARGVFGVPTLIVGDEPFFGVDGIELAELALAGRDPIADVDLSRWRDLPATAHRRG